MKIEDTGSLRVPVPGAQGPGGTEPAGRRDGGRGVQGNGIDSAELSGLAGKISQAAGQDTTGRAAKVEQLRAAVASGDYQPDIGATSRGIVDDALESSAKS